MFQSVILALEILLFLIPYLILLDITSERIVAKNMLPVLAFILMVVYLCGIGLFMKVYELFNQDAMLIYTVFGIGAAVTLIYMLRTLIKFWSVTNKRVFGLLVIYIAMMLSLTLFMRIGTRESWMYQSHIEPFMAVKKAMTYQNSAYLTDFVRNILVFIPFGVMIPLLDRIRYKRPGFTLLYAGIFSTGIELTQHITHLGMFDLDDIIANVTGAFIGYLFCFVVLLLVEKPQKETRHAARTAA